MPARPHTQEQCKSVQRGTRRKGQATRQTIAKSLEGTWQPDLLFVLQPEVAMYDAYLQRITERDQALEQHPKGYADKTAATLPDTEPSPTPAQHARRSGPKRRRKAAAMWPIPANRRL